MTTLTSASGGENGSPASPDVSDLRRCIRDLVALSTLTAAWPNSPPLQGAQSLATALVTVLDAEFVCVALSGKYEEAIVDVGRSANARPDAAALIRAALREEAPRIVAGKAAVIRNPIGADALHLTSASIGLRGDAMLTVASSRPDFPTEMQRLLLQVGTNQLAVAVDRWYAANESRRFASLVESSYDFVGIASLEGVPRYINPAGLTLVGLGGVHEAAALHVLDFVVPEERQRVQEELWPIVMDVGRWVGEIPFRHFKSGTVIPLLVDWFRVDDPHTGEPMNIATVSRDLTNQKRAETELRHLNETLEQRVLARTAEAFEANQNLRIEMIERARADARSQKFQSELFHAARLSAIGQMAAAFAHELSQPLGAAANFGNAARRLLKRGDQQQIDLVRRCVEDATAQVLRAGQILRRLRDFVTQGDTERRAENLAKMVDEARALALAGAQTLAVEVRRDLAVKDLFVFVNRIEVQQVLVNLIRNALEGMADSERRTLTLAAILRDEETAEVSVADSGPGLDREVMDRLFEPFVSTKRNGMGLGLSICRTIVEAHGGQIWSEPNPAGGTIFRFTLPALLMDECGDAG
jgi:PAS domain S-box-containing protein